MTLGAQSRDDTRVGGGPGERGAASKPNAGEGSSYILAVRWSSARRIGIELVSSELAKRKRALLGSNPPRNSRLETHSDEPGADRNWPAPGIRRCQATISAKHIGVDLPIP